ncbi:nicotinate phosphoribosyltransferase [Canibacter sp. lx-72]|uniref:nicotinate phosphoribosyltransferase n=1 Tax=Canibacter zhuwentaonis TaxID=2837491 RepID=UPI001BDC8BAC|nr:nicotinate phosphoribosyltransferase [Canibacter zhuwentaonis]MBT1017671.1 nicotinate phosphoribosyltransferase [Canibacter zhuwentaonis]
MTNTSSALRTDHYELTMVDAALRAGTANRASVFEVFTRRLNGARRYAVLAGTGRMLEAIKQFRFTQQELEYLEKRNFLRPETLDWLANYRFRGSISGYLEGEIFFPHSPLLTVESSFAEGVLLETIVLSILNHDSAIATAASRMVMASQNRSLTEMGSRRTSETSAVYAARAAYIAGFAATSNLEAGRSYAIPTMGTAAHSFTLLHDSELDAFRAQVAAYGSNTTLLIDTYDIEQGVHNAIAAAGTELSAVRIDSGDIPVVASKVRKLLDSLGAHNTKITVTNDLDEHTIAALAVAPVDSFGVGTSVVTGSGTPTLGMVYKLVARQDKSGQWQPVSKKSEGKISRGGKKVGMRQSAAEPTAEIVGILDATTKFHEIKPPAGLDLISAPLVTNGEINPKNTGVQGIARARQLHARRLSSLPPVAHSMRRGEPALNTEFIEL